MRVDVELRRQGSIIDAVVFVEGFRYGVADAVPADIALVGQDKGGDRGSKAMPLRSSCWPMAEMMAAISSGGAPQSRRKWNAMRAPVWAWSTRLMLFPKSCI